MNALACPIDRPTTPIRRRRVAKYFAIDTRELGTWYKRASTDAGYSANIELIGETDSPRLSVNCNYSYTKERPWCEMLQSSWATPLPVRHGDKGNAEASSSQRRN